MESNFEKYYGIKEYKSYQHELRLNNQCIQFTKQEKLFILSNILDLISDKDYLLYHDLMDDLRKNRYDWFNMLTFDRKMNCLVLDYIKSRVQSLYYSINRR